MQINQQLAVTAAEAARLKISFTQLNTEVNNLVQLQQINIRQQRGGGGGGGGGGGALGMLGIARGGPAGIAIAGGIAALSVLNSMTREAFTNPNVSTFESIRRWGLGKARYFMPEATEKEMAADLTYERMEPFARMAARAGQPMGQGQLQSMFEVINMQSELEAKTINQLRDLTGRHVANVTETKILKTLEEIRDRCTLPPSSSSLGSPGKHMPVH